MILSAPPGNRLDFTYCPAPRTERQSGQDLLPLASVAPSADRRAPERRRFEFDRRLRIPKRAAARRHAATRAATETAIDSLYMEGRDAF
jgi:hypothetical protein